MTTHNLKTWMEPFADLVAGTKTFELRPDDRGFEVGDRLVLQEWSLRGYSGAWVAAEVTHILRDATEFGLRPGFCVLSLRITERTALARSTGGAA